MAYASETLSLATLELYVHLPSTLLPMDLVAVEIQVPDLLPLEEWTVESLPSDWDSQTFMDATQALGSAWVASTRTLLLRVPSVIVPREWNVLVNPSHPDFPKLRVQPPQRFTLDPRLARSR